MKKHTRRKALNLFLAVAMLASMIPALGGAAAPASEFSGNIVMHLPFEDSLADLATPPNTVTTTGGTLTYVEGVDGNRAVSLSGARLNLGTSAALNPGNLTVSFWVNPNATMSGETIFMWTKNMYNDDGWYIGSEDANRPLILSVGTGSPQPLEFRVTGVARAAFFPANTWTHIAATYNGDTREAVIYRNGIPQELAISNLGSPGIINDGPGVEKFIGRNGGHGSTLINSRLDEFIVFDAVLPHSEIIELYEAMRQFDPIALLNADAAAIMLPTRTSSDLLLPSEGANGSEISWASGNTAVITDAGVVTLPEVGEIDVTMTATLTGFGESITREFVVTVVALGEVPFALQDVGTENVSLHDPYLLNSELKLIELLLSLEPLRFLAHFYTTAGLPRPGPSPTSPTGAEPYNQLVNMVTGALEDTWERTTGNNFRGHMFGHYMSALAMAYNAYEPTGPDDTIREQILAKLMECIIELQKCQAASYTNPNVNDGYIGPFGDIRLDAMDGLSVGRGVSSGTVFVPWYNLHKVYVGLIDTFKYTQGVPLPEPIDHQGTIFTDLGELALDIVSRYADYFHDTRLVNYTQANRNQLLNIEYGGMNDMFYELYNITGKLEHRLAAEAFDETVLFNALAAGNGNILVNRHANTQVPKFVGAINRYTTLTQNPVFFNNLSTAEQGLLTSRYRAAAENFFDIVIEDHTYITGGHSVDEHFRQPNSLAATIQNPATHETCNVYNMLKLTRELFKITQDIKYADYYENAFLNTIISSQCPETGYMMYFQPMGSGYNKVFGFNRFWCCTGTGIENFVKLGDSIYFTGGDRVYVNMFFSSELRYAERNLSLTQESNLYFSDPSKPFSDTVHFTVGAIDASAPLGVVDLYIRVPDWTAGSATLVVNGEQIENPLMSGGYILLRNVAVGDEISVTFPMEVTVDALVDNPNVMAFKYGPMVLSTGMGTWNMGGTNPNGILVLVPQHDNNAPSLVIIDNGQTVDEWRADIANNLVRVEDTPNGEPQFRLNGTMMDDVFLYTPHYRRHAERYGLYFTFIDAADPSVVQEIVFSRKIVERESEGASAFLSQFDGHAWEGGLVLRESGTVAGDWNGRQFRSSAGANTQGAFFSYELPVVPGEQNYLNTILARADNGRSWDILINGEPFATESVTNNITVGTCIDTTFYAMTRAIPIQYTSGPGLRVKQIDGEDVPYVTVEFRRTTGWLGRLFGFSVTQRPVMFDSNPNLRELSFEGGVLYPAFDPDIKEYTLTPDEGATSVIMTARPHKDSGIVTVGGFIIDDTQPFEVSVPYFLSVTSYAQNHLTSAVYTISVGGAEDPGPSPHLNPRVWYRMDETSGTTIADSSGFGHANGTLVGSGASMLADGSGVNLVRASASGTAAAAAGHVVLPRTIFRDVPGDFTISIRTFFTAANTWARIFDFGPGSASNIMFLTANNLQFMMDNANPIIPPAAQSNTNNVGRWRQITITHSGGLTNMYIDGARVASAPQSSNANRTPATGGNFFLGRANWTDPFPTMRLSDFRIYSRAMTPLEAAIMFGEGQVAGAFDMLALPEALNHGDLLQPAVAGFPIMWTSSDPGAIADDGFTIVGIVGEERQATLTATIIGVEGLEKDFDVTIQPAPEPVTTLDDYLLLHLQFDDDTVAGTVGQAIPTGNIGFADGIYGRAANFNNTANTFITLNREDGESVVKDLDAYSVSFWVMPTHTRTGWWWYSSRDASQQSPGSERYTGIFTNAQTLRAERFLNGRAFPSASNTGAPTPTDQWTHVTAVYCEEALTVYHNGRLFASVNSPASLAEIHGDNQIARIGRASWGTGGENATGRIDEVKVFSRALTADEALTVYAENADVDVWDFLEVPAVVYGGYELPGSIAGQTVTWTSSDPSALGADGRTIVAGAEDKQVTLTAVIGAESRDFAVTIPSVLMSLSLPATTYSDLELPASILGYEITWASQTPDVIDSSGRILVDEEQRPARAVLVATITEGQLPFSRTFNVTVVPEIPVEGYLFAHFLTNADTRVYYSFSYDGYHFRMINNRNPVFRNPVGFNQSRDPFLFRGEDGFYYMLATDLNVWWGDPYIIVTRSSDLVHWETPLRIRYDVAFESTRTAMRAWAPQAIWVPEREQYMVYLSIDIADGVGTVMWRHYTSDLMDITKYTEPELMLVDHEQPGTIDGDIYFDPFAERWIMFYSGQYIAVSDGGIDGNYSILRNEDGTRFTISPYRLEGTHIYRLKHEDKWIIAADGTSFELGRYSVIETTDFQNFRTLAPHEYSFDVHPRHGYVLSLSRAETSIIKAAFDNPEESVIVYNDFSNTVSAVYVNTTASSVSNTLVAGVFDAEGRLVEFRYAHFTAGPNGTTPLISLRLESDLTDKDLKAFFAGTGKAALVEAIAGAPTEQGEYPDAQWQTFLAALNAAIAAAQDESATQAEVDAALSALEAAIEALQQQEEITLVRLNLNAITRVARNSTLDDIGITVNAGASSQGVILTTSNQAMATIGPDGRSVITGTRAGTVTLTATDPESGRRHSVTLMIT